MTNAPKRPSAGPYLYTPRDPPSPAEPAIPRVIQMIEFRGSLIVATDRGLYWLDYHAGKLVPILFEPRDSPVRSPAVNPETEQVPW